jgi:competence protein ComEC
VTRQQRLLLALCVGLALATLVHMPHLSALALVTLACALAGVLAGARSAAWLGVALLVTGWWWGSARLERLDRSVLLPRVGTSEVALVETTAPVRRGKFDQRVAARVLRFGRLRPHEPVLLELPPGRAPPLGGRLEVLGELRLPRPASHGFDERAYLRRQGIHVVLKADRWRLVGRRGGLAGVGDSIHRRVASAVGRGLHGERRALVEGFVLGEDQGLSDNLRADFRASGLYHLLAVSGQNVAYVAAAALGLAWLLGLPRLLGHAFAVASIGAYVAAVGFQPSVVRAGIAGVLASVAWMTARRRDRWYALLLGAAGLLAWNPYLVRDAGFELSFAAVLAIFTLAPRVRVRLEGYPVPNWLAETIAISTACGVTTAPIAWFQFHQVPLLTVPANALAAPVVAPLLWLGLVSVGVDSFAPGVAAALNWFNGWFAAYLAACARVVGGLPGAQIRSGRALAGIAAVVLLVAAYACRRGERAEAGLPPHRQRPPEDRARAPAPAGTRR